MNQLSFIPELEIIEYSVMELFPPTCKCGLCDEITVMDYSLPMYEGGIVSEDNPEWVGQVVCKKCFDKHGWKAEVNWYER